MEPVRIDQNLTKYQKASERACADVISIETPVYAYIISWKRSNRVDLTNRKTTNQPTKRIFMRTHAHACDRVLFSCFHHFLPIEFFCCLLLDAIKISIIVYMCI